MAKNVVVFGLSETAEEDVKGSRDRLMRPVLVELRSGVVAAAIRKKVGKLKNGLIQFSLHLP